MIRAITEITRRMKDCSDDEIALVVDVLEIVIRESQGWTRRSDDAKRIPDAIEDVRSKVEEMLHR
jgi:hypothetical protein